VRQKPQERHRTTESQQPRCGIQFDAMSRYSVQLTIAIIASGAGAVLFAQVVINWAIVPVSMDASVPAQSGPFFCHPVFR